jgi:hypothetical protein
MKKEKHIHTYDHGRGPRLCFVDGVPTRHVIEANTLLGVVRVAVVPLQTDKHGELLTKTIHGKVEVVY